MSKPKELGKRRFEELPMSQLIYDPDFNCRQNVTPQSVATLSEGMDAAGLIHPILVRPWGKKFKIVAGHRRYRAAKLLKWDKVWCDIREGLTDEEACILNYTENLLRSDLNMVEEAEYLIKLFPNLGTPKQISIRECSRRIKQSIRWISMRLRLLTLPKYIKEMFASGRLPKHTVDAIFKVKKAERPKLLKKIAKAIDPAKGILDHDKLPESVRRKYKKPLTQSQVSRWIVKVLDVTTTGLVPLAMAMAAGMISEDEFQKALDKAAPALQALKAESLAKTDL